MSSANTDPAEVAAFIAVYDTLSLSNRCGIASFTLLVYEYLVTFDQEVRMFWHGRWTGATILFFLTRYIPILAYAAEVMEFISMSDESCNQLVKVSNGLLYVQYLTWATFSAMRALALSRKWYIAVPIFGLSVVGFGVNMSQYGLGLFGANDPIFGCMPEILITAEEAKKLTIVVRTCLITADLCLIIITWVGIPNFGSIRQTMRVSTLSTILMRDGLIYFAVLLVLNSLHLACTMISFVRAYWPTSYITTFTEPITAVMVARFLLDLQAANRNALLMDAEDPLSISTASSSSGTLNFARVFGSLGSSIGAGEAGQGSDVHTTGSSDDSGPTHVADKEDRESPIVFKEGASPGSYGM